MTEILHRAYEATIERTTPETLTARLVPYNTPAQIAELTERGMVRYVEEFAPGAFDFQVKHRDARSVIGRIRLMDEHDGGSGKLGQARALTDTPEGLVGEFAVFPSRAPDVEQLLDGGQGGVSIGFHPLTKPLVRKDGTYVRTAAFLHHVALVPHGAYPGAEVLSFRADELIEADATEAARLAEEEAQLRRRELVDWLAREKARNEEWLARTGAP